MKAILYIIAAALLLMISVLIISRLVLNRQFQNQAQAILKEAQGAGPAVITADDLENLPGVVQKYLRRSGIIGKRRITSVHLVQSGLFRTAPDKDYRPLRAEQYYTINPPAFIWKGSVSMAPFLSVDGIDLYRSGQGRMKIRLLSLIPVVNATGPEMDQGAMTRFFNEIMWFPTAWLSDYISWQEIDSSSARATMSRGGISASAVLTFDEQGRLKNFECERYYSKPGGGFSLEEWATPVTGYKEFQGIKIPTTGAGIWHLADGDFKYIEPEVVRIEYNFD